MKKNLLLLGGMLLATATVAQAAEPVTLENTLLTKVSKSGLWAAGRDGDMNIITIFNTKTGETKEIEYGTYGADPGTGNAISDNGILVLSTTIDGDASYVENGETKSLPVPEDATSAFSNGVTPDASRICGTVGIGMTLEDAIMQTPVLWIRNADGTYADPISLPYPNRDWTNRVPQYVQAIAISEDGKTIAGQMVDYMGQIFQPIVWKENNDGEWSYEFVHPELFNPNKVDIPEYPGEGPDYPDATDFMTPDEADAYNAAVAEWWETYEGPYPDAADFMSASEQEAYNAAMEKYQEEYNEWEEKFDAFQEAINEAMEGTPFFGMNIVSLSPNGRYYGTVYNYSDFWTMTNIYYPFIFDLETGEYYDREDVADLGILTTQVTNSGAVLGGAPGASYTRNAYMSETPDGEFTALEEVIEKVDTELYAWMDENLRHDVISYDYVENEDGEWEEVVNTEEDKWLTGTPMASDDLKVIVLFQNNSWDYEIGINDYSYVMQCDALDAVEGIAADAKALTVSMDKNGVVTINGEAKALNIYDVNGRTVYSASNPEATVSTDLKAGVYVIKVEGKDGKNVVAKAII